MSIPMKVRIVRSAMRRLEPSSPRLAEFFGTLAPDDTEVTLRLARMAENTRGPLEAAKYLETTDGIAENPDLLKRRAYYLEKAGAYQDAVGVYDKMIALHHNDQEAHLLRAKCYIKLEQDQLALESAEVAAALSPTLKEAHELVVKLSSKLPPWRRLALLIAGLPAHADSTAWRRRLAKTAFDMKKWRLAADHYSWCEEHEEIQSDALYAGLALSRSGDLRGAREHWKVAVSRDKREAIKSLGVGRLLQERGLWREAANEYIHDMQQRSVNDPALLHAAGFALSRQYLWAKATGYLRRAVQLEPENKKYWYDLAFCFERRGHYADAALSYRKSIDSESPLAYRRYRMMSCLLKAGNHAAVADEILAVSPDLGSKQDSIAWNVDVLSEDLKNALESCDASACMAVATAAESIGNDDLANRAFMEAEARMVTHDPNFYVRHAACLARLGRAVEAGEVYLQSKQFGGAYGVSVEDCFKTKAERESALFVAYSKTMPVNTEVILYESSHGASITCSVRPLLKRMLESKRGQSMTHVVVINDRERIPDELLGGANVVFVPKQSDSYIRYLATAGWLISNNTFPPYFSRRDGQKYLNVWHGTPIKSLGIDIKSGALDYRNATRNFLHVTHFAFPNEFTGRVLMQRYGVADIFPGKVKITGSPRMDVTLNLGTETRRTIRRRLGALEGQRVVLYAPTWRGDLSETRVDIKRIKTDLAAMSCGDVVVAFRAHSLMEKGMQTFSGEAIVVPADIDTNELIASVDIVVSDYSSIAIDAIGAGVRTILYTYDREEYERERGLYLRLEDLPVEVAVDRDSLREAIAQIAGECRSDNGMYHELWGHEDGKATDRVLDFFFEDEGCEEFGWMRKNGKRKVLLFEGHFIPNGVTSSARELNKYLVADGVGVSLSVEGAKIVAFSERMATFRSLPDGVSVLPAVGVGLWDPEEIWINRTFMSRDLLWSDEQYAILRDAYAREYRRLYGAASFDSAVCFEGYSRYWVLVMAAAPNGTRKVIFLHNDMVDERNMRFPYLDGIFQVYPWFDALVSVSESATTANRFRLPVRVDDERFVTAENLVDPDCIQELSSASVCEEFSAFKAKHRGTLYINVGRMTEQKGHLSLVEAFARARRSDDGLVIVGDGPLMGVVRARIGQLGLENSILLLGFKDNPFPYLRNSDVFVLSSTYEGQGIVVLEALSVGLRVVSFDIPGPRSILAHGGGLLVGRSVEALAGGMVSVRDNYGVASFDMDAYLVAAREHYGVALGF